MYNWLLTSSTWMLTPVSHIQPQLSCVTARSKHIPTKTEKKKKIFGTLVHKLCYFSFWVQLTCSQDGSQSFKFSVSYLCVFCLNKRCVPDPLSVSVLYLCVETQ